MKTRLLLTFAFALALLAASEGRAQAPPKHEFRGAWIATVANLDWPDSKTASTAQQKESLVEVLDSLKAAGVNAVLFQVRTEADALYASDLEPWSYWLTGAQGQAPEPFYDPLQFAVEEAHERGMELHAWFNPFRAVDAGSDYEQAAGHVAQEHPEWLLGFENGLKILNPGLPEVRDYVTSVVMDVVQRYDVDGVHFDDYFYPYPPNQMDQEGNRNKDRDAFEADPRGFDDIENWRRDNVNLFVEQVHDSLQAAAPQVTFGISPFGIWKSGVPSGITGLSAYHTVYADAVAWLEAQTVDYLAPQLYWGFGGGQDYATLAPWWAGKASANNRHLYPGLAAYKTDPATFYDPSDYQPNTVPRQVRFNRQHSGIQGSIFFRAENLTRFPSKGLADSLKQDLYRYPALTPTMPWKSTAAPDTPQNVAYTRSGPDGEVVALEWEAVPETERYAVYRVQSSTPPDARAAMQEAENLLAVTGPPPYEDRPLQAEQPYHYFVTAVSANAVESAPSASVEAEGRAEGGGGGGGTPKGFIPEWERNAATGNAPNTASDGVAYGVIDADASGATTHERVLLAQRGAGVQILNANTGSNAGRLEAAGVTGPLAPNDVEVSDDGLIFACDLTVDASASPFDCYRWDHENDAPTNVISFTTATAQRLGDHITVAGSAADGSVTLWAPAASSNTVYRFASTDGGMTFTPTTITLTGAPTAPSSGFAPDVAPTGPGASGFYYNARLVPVQEYSATGAFEEQISTGLISDNTHGTSFFEKGSKDFLLAMNAAGNDGLISEVTDGSKSVYAITPSQGTDGETSGDVAVRDNGDGTYTAYVLATSSGLGAYTTTGAPLPVEFALPLTATVEARDVILRWRTAGETNNLRFEVQQQPPDGTWQKIGQRAGAGTTTEPRGYRFRVADLEPGTHRFRLRQVDRDGAKTLTEPAKATVRPQDAHALSGPAPNPFRTATTLKLSVRERQHVRAHVYDVLGRRVATLHDGPAQGAMELRLEAKSLSSGVYVVRVRGEHFTEIRKVTLVR